MQVQTYKEATLQDVNPEKVEFPAMRREPYKYKLMYT